jgi:hypothetical protein
MSFDEAISMASRDERFRATVYAMNTLLIEKGIYTKEEFERLFAEWVSKGRRSEKSGRNLRAAGGVLAGS